MEVTARAGQVFNVDTSEAVIAFSGRLNHGDRFIDHGDSGALGPVTGTVIGVGPPTDESIILKHPLVLWVRLDTDNYVSCYTLEQCPTLGHINAQETLVTPCHGRPFLVDISDEACRPFGFKHGEHIVEICDIFESTVVGVGPMGGTCTTMVLWVIRRQDNGRASFLSITEAITRYASLDA